MLVDLTDEIDQNDSGMESLTCSKDDTPERKPEDNIISTISAIPASSKEYEDEPDETLSERLWGLTEMFPEPIRNATHTVTTKSWSGVKSLYGLSRSIMWIVASSSVILFAPVIFEIERAQVDEMQKTQQKQVLLGPNAGLTGPMPPIPR